MINILNLLWIVPLSSSFGFFVAALLSANHREDENNEKQTSIND